METVAPILHEEACINQSWLIFRAIDHKLRSRMLRMIDEQGEMTVTELYMQLNMEQSLVSQHLAILRKSYFVTTKRVGKYVYYSVNYDHLHLVQDLAKKLAF